MEMTAMRMLGPLNKGAGMVGAFPSQSYFPAPVLQRLSMAQLPLSLG
jgi:hypothetical protein